MDDMCVMVWSITIGVWDIMWNDYKILCVVSHCMVLQIGTQVCIDIGKHHIIVDNVTNWYIQWRFDLCQHDNDPPHTQLICKVCYRMSVIGAPYHQQLSTPWRVWDVCTVINANPISLHPQQTTTL